MCDGRVKLAAAEQRIAQLTASMKAANPLTPYDFGMIHSSVISQAPPAVSAMHTGPAAQQCTQDPAAMPLSAGLAPPVYNADMNHNRELLSDARDPSVAVAADRHHTTLSGLPGHAAICQITDSAAQSHAAVHSCSEQSAAIPTLAEPGDNHVLMPSTAPAAASSHLSNPPAAAAQAASSGSSTCNLAEGNSSQKSEASRHEDCIGAVAEAANARPPACAASQLPAFSNVQLAVSRGAMEGWVEQASPCCGAASVAGAWNAVRPAGTALGPALPCPDLRLHLC